MADLHQLQINGGYQSTSSSSSPRNPSPTSPLLLPHSTPPALGYYAPPPPIYNFYFIPPHLHHPQPHYYLPPSFPIHGGPHFPPSVMGPPLLPKRKVKRSKKRNNRGKKMVWMPKQNVNSGSSHPLPPPPPTLKAGCTTVMVKNIPNAVSRKGMMKILDQHCRMQNQKMNGVVSQYDFLYLPFDFRSKMNMGYAFVNFTSAEGASLLNKCWTGMGWARSPKIRLVTSAKLQGLEKCKMHFSRSVFYCQSENYLPVEFTPPRDGSNGDTCKMIATGRWAYRYNVNTRQIKWTPNHKAIIANRKAIIANRTANIPDRKMNIPPRQRLIR